MRKIRDVLRLSAAGMSKRQIAASLRVSATAAAEMLPADACLANPSRLQPARTRDDSPHHST